MNAVKRTCALTLALGALGAGCGGDSGNNDGDPDAAASVLDASLGDAGAGDAGFPCTSYTKAKLPALCGGSHCQQSPEKLRMDTPTTAKCGTNDEVTSFCSLKAVDVVGNCAVQAFGDATATRTCATPLLPELTASCLNCYLDSANCAKEHCFAECLSRETPECDECRVKQGCITSFYQCAGFVNPLPPEYQL